jgi:hypothetical protein
VSITRRPDDIQVKPWRCRAARLAGSLRPHIAADREVGQGGAVRRRARELIALVLRGELRPVGALCVPTTTYRSVAVPTTGANIAVLIPLHCAQGFA